MALLDRVLVRGPKQGSPGPMTEADESRMTLVEHLEDLRRALLVAVLAWVVGGIISFVFWGRVIDFLIQRGGIHSAVYTGPTGAFFIALKVAIGLGFAIAYPVLVQQAWWFVSPGLHRHERRLVLPLILATTFFFLLGVGVALFSLPLFIKILGGFAPADLHYLPFIDDYVGFILLLVIGFGLVFELPVVLFVLGMMRIIKTRWLYKNRLYWIVGLAVAANFLTPGADPLTPLIMFVPLYVFWEGTALLLKLMGR